TAAEDALTTDMEGPICDSTNTLEWHCLPLTSRGALVVIAHSDAYPASFSSRHKCRPQPPEILFEPDGALTPSSHAHVPRCFHPGASSPTNAAPEFRRCSSMPGYHHGPKPSASYPTEHPLGRESSPHRPCRPALASRSHNDFVGT